MTNNTERTRVKQEPEMIDEDTMRLYGVGPECPGCGGSTHCVGPAGERPWWCKNCNVRLDDSGEYGSQADFPAGCDPEKDIVTDGGRRTDVVNRNGVDPDRLAGCEYQVTLEYTVEYTATVFAGPHPYSAIDRAKEIAFPGGPTDPSDWDCVLADTDELREIWMGDVEAPKAADWLDKPHVPSEDTYWDDTQHFEEVEGQ